MTPTTMRQPKLSSKASGKGDIIDSNLAQDLRSTSTLFPSAIGQQDESYLYDEHHLIRHGCEREVGLSSFEAHQLLTLWIDTMDVIPRTKIKDP